MLRMNDHLPNSRIEKAAPTLFFVVTKAPEDNTVLDVLSSMLKGIITAFFRVFISTEELPP